MTEVQHHSGGPGLPVLDAVEQRVLGSLLEKEVTVPGSYPMTVNSVRLACNQTSSREPVTDLDERVVHETLRNLKQQDLARVVWQDTGKRTMKYLQTLTEKLGLGPDERALLTVLLLRGAQAPGALKTRTERLHPFADRGAVEECLKTMAAAEPPLVRELERRAREQDNRWIHLLGPVELEAAAPAISGVDRDSVIADGAQARDERVRASYDSIAEAYADHLVPELAALPFETWLLDRVAAAAGDGPVVEVGCGPGHVTAYLAGCGATASGLDLSPAMIEVARARFPDGTYDIGDLRRLMRPTTAGGWAAVLAWYSLIHLAAAELPEAISSLVRPLAPGGWLVIGLHAGSEVLHADEWFDAPVSLDFVLHEPAAIIGLVEAAGLVDVEWYHRSALVSRGETTDRLYVIGRAPVA